MPGTIPGFNVPGTFANKKLPTQWAINNAYNIPRVANVFWVGAKYSVPPDWMHGWGSADLTGAYYWLGQNNYNFAVATTGPLAGVTAPAACTTVVTNGTKPNGQAFSIARVNSGKCAGSTDFISFLIDWRPVKRVDIYAGVMELNVYAGLANGYFATQTINPTAGIRIKF